MGGGKKVNDTVPTTKSDLGLFGSTTTGHFGSKFDASDFQKQFTTNAQDALLKAQNAYNNREIAQEAIDNMNRQYQTDFQNNLLAPALNKGWLRGSTAQDVATVANQDYQNRRYDLVNQELNRQQQNLANNLANYMTMYDMAKGVTGLSNALNSQISNFQLEAQRANQQSADERYKANMAVLSSALTGGGDKSSAAATAAAASDIRLKENIEKLDTVDGVNIYKFDYINGAKDQVGVIAQEMQKVCPECVTTKEDGYLAVDYSKLPTKVQARIEELNNGN